MSGKEPTSVGVIYRLPISELHPHPDNPFAIREDNSMNELIESVKSSGVLVPAIARQKDDGSYELISGHRRKKASELAGLDSMPVIVLDLDDDAAIIQLVDSNIQRENILPSERAKAYKLKMDAIKRQGARSDLTSPKISAKFCNCQDKSTLSGGALTGPEHIVKIIYEHIFLYKVFKIIPHPCLNVAQLLR